MILCAYLIWASFRSRNLVRMDNFLLSQYRSLNESQLYIMFDWIHFRVFFAYLKFHLSIYNYIPLRPFFPATKPYLAFQCWHGMFTCMLTRTPISSYSILVWFFVINFISPYKSKLDVKWLKHPLGMLQKRTSFFLHILLLFLVLEFCVCYNASFFIIYSNISNLFQDQDLNPRQNVEGF